VESANAKKRPEAETPVAVSDINPDCDVRFLRYALLLAPY